MQICMCKPGPQHLCDLPASNGLMAVGMPRPVAEHEYIAMEAWGAAQDCISCKAVCLEIPTLWV